MASFDETLQKELIEVRRENDYLKKQLEQYDDYEDERSELEDYINSHTWIDVEGVKTLERASVRFLECELRVLRDLIDSADRFAKDKYEYLLQQQRDITYEHAEVCALLDCLEDVSDTYKGTLEKEIEEVYDLPDPSIEI